MASEMKSFLGTGWSFPPSFDRRHAGVHLVSDEEDIAQSIFVILNTTPGERIMQPEFGCDLKRLVFEQLNDSLLSGLNFMIYHALLNFEPRIHFINAEIVDRENLDGVLHIRVNYSIVITNTRHNIVFPFYLTEGTNLLETELRQLNE
jgi:phage baseplate assembly protein W